MKKVAEPLYLIMRSILAGEQEKSTAASNGSSQNNAPTEAFFKVKPTIRREEESNDSDNEWVVLSSDGDSDVGSEYLLSLHSSNDTLSEAGQSEGASKDEEVKEDFISCNNIYHPKLYKLQSKDGKIYDYTTRCMDDSDHLPRVDFSISLLEHIFHHVVTPRKVTPRQYIEAMIAEESRLEDKPLEVPSREKLLPSRILRQMNRNGVEAMRSKIGIKEKQITRNLPTDRRRLGRRNISQKPQYW